MNNSPVKRGEEQRGRLNEKGGPAMAGPRGSCRLLLTLVVMLCVLVLAAPSRAGLLTTRLTDNPAGALLGCPARGLSDAPGITGPVLVSGPIRTPLPQRAAALVA